MKPQVWNDQRAKKELADRLRDAMNYRATFETQWEQNDVTLDNSRGRSPYPDARYSFDSKIDLNMGEIDSGNETTGVNYAFKNYRFIHAQLSANPPTVLARPTSTDPSDHDKADAADRLIRHAIRSEFMQDKTDLMAASTLRYGTGWMKTVFDPNLGDIVDFDAETGEFDLEGQIDVYSPSTWNVWVDPSADSWTKVRYAFEKKTMALDEAIQLWPECAEKLKEHASKTLRDGQNREYSAMEEQSVDIYEYWEKGLPINGMVGRFNIHLKDGTLLRPQAISPQAFKSPLLSPDMPPTAELPYHVFTDIDVPGQVYGKSFLDYEGPVQDIMNRLDSTTLDAIQAHCVTRMVLPESAEIAEDSITNSNWDIVKVTGTQGPWFVQPPKLMPDMAPFRDRLKAGGDDLAGVNEAMFGQQSREQSGFSMQYATNQGNMIRRRLFNKYTMVVESIYRGYLNLVKTHWDDPRIIQVLGTENAFETKEIRGADISGGYNLIVEYGASLSLDPTTRREEILQLMPVLKDAGVDTKTILTMLKLTELDTLYDILKMSEQRQSEIFKEMNNKHKYIAPEEFQEHKGMLAYCYRYVMTAEYKYLTPDQKALIEAHIRAREQLAAGPVQVPGPTAPVGAPAGGPAPGELAAASGAGTPITETVAGGGLPAGPTVA